MFIQHTCQFHIHRKFHTDNTQHLSPVYQFITFRVKLNRHSYLTPHLVYGPMYVPTFSHLPNSVDTHTDLCQTQPTYLSDIPTGLWTYIPTLTINIPPKLPNSADTPTKLNTPTDVELNNGSQSTYLPRYQTQPTLLPNYMHQPM